MNYAVEDPSQVYCNPTGISRFMACETKWALHSLLGVDKRRGPDSDVRDRGKAMHVFVEYAVRQYAESDVVWAFEGEVGKQAARDIFEDLHDAEGIDFDEQICHDLLAAARAQIPKIGLEKFDVVKRDGELMVELNLRETIDGVPFQAIVDAVLVHKVTGEYWVIDWKTTADAISTADPKRPNYVEHDMQLALQRLLLDVASPIDQSALVQIRSLAPQPPPLTTRKKLTRDLKKLSCDAPTYYEALVANGENPFEKKTAAKLRELKHSVFVRWLPDVTSEAGKARLESELFKIGRRMQVLAKGEDTPRMAIRNTTGHAPYAGGCARCDYQNWCRAAIRNGGEPDFSLVGVEYVRNDKATFEGVEGKTPTPTSADYVEFARAYGNPEPHALKPFTP